MFSCAADILPNGINTAGRPIAGVDWSRSEVIVNVKGKPLGRFKTLADAAKQYVGYVWALEATADSFELQNRAVDIAAIEAADIWAYCFNSKYTSTYRIKWNDIPKTDEADSEVIRRIFTETKLSCSPFREIVEKDKDTLRKKINKTIIEDRQFEGKQSIEVAKKILPAFSDVPQYLHEFLYKPESIKAKKPKNPTPKKQIGRLLMAAGLVRQTKGGWRVLEKQVGNYGQGYGCMLRSEYQWWLVRPITAARLKKMGIEKDVKISHIDPKTKEEKSVRLWSPEENKVKRQVMREMRDVLKYLWRLTA